jgi:type I restriction enzyme, S subunit
MDMTTNGIELKDIQYVPDEIFSIIKNYRIYEDNIYISVAGTLGIYGKIVKEKSIIAFNL